ncbi:unnamed protein product, partial [Iphiclides podalirius]
MIDFGVTEPQFEPTTATHRAYERTAAALPFRSVIGIRLIKLVNCRRDRPDVDGFMAHAAPARLEFNPADGHGARADGTDKTYAFTFSWNGFNTTAIQKTDKTI